MKTLISLEAISLSFGLNKLLDNVSLQILSGERICLIGCNGTGKSSLLKIIDGKITADHGSVFRQPQLRIATLEQELPSKTSLTVYEYVALGLAETGRLLTAYETLTEKIAKTHHNDDLIQLQKIQQQIDAADGWHFERQIKTILTQLALDAKKSIQELSGGWQRRAALAKALVSSPELLLLDEPTNHLDMPMIQWLEEMLKSSPITLVFVTHDRALLERLATRIIELDRGHLSSWPGDYANFLRRKEELRQAEDKQHRDFDKKLAQEETWIRQGIKARRTRNEGRVRLLEAMRLKHAQRRERLSGANFNIELAESSGQLVIDAKNISYYQDEQPLIKNLSLRIMRGDRIGLVGANGSGKTTLLQLLLGKLSPAEGEITLGTKLQIAYFDQLRQGLELEKSVFDNVAHGREFIEIANKKRHVISYLSDFLFTRERALTPVKALSGGECNRLLLAKLFSTANNVLVLDEPTNDLDIETLELLEELLLNYQGTILLVSHDRAFVDHVVTSILYFKGQGVIEEYVGNIHDHLHRRPPIIKQEIPKKSVTEPSGTLINKPKTKKLSYKEQKELAELPELIEQLEKHQQQLQQMIADEQFYKQDHQQVKRTLADLSKTERKLTEAYQRWEILENEQNSNQSTM